MVSRRGLGSMAILLASTLRQPDANGADNDAGARLVRIDDGTAGGHCINGSKESVWLTLRRVVTQKHSGFLTSDRSVSLVAKVTVGTDPQPDKPIVFPVTKEAGLARYRSGQVSVPIEFPLTTGFKLTQEKVRYTGFDVEITILNLRGKSTWGKALSALSDVATGFPIPASPAKTAGVYLLDVANKAVKDDLDSQAADMKLLSADFSLNFSPDGGGCPAVEKNVGDFERSGTKMILYSTGTTESKAFVPIADVDQYCFTAAFTPSFAVKVSKLQSDGSCGKDYQEVANDYVAFYLNARDTSAKLGGGDKDTQEAIKRCHTNGVMNDAACLAVSK